MVDLKQVRQQAAASYPDTLTDSKGREHPCIPRRRILAGDWDDGSLVQAFVQALEGRDG